MCKFRFRLVHWIEHSSACKVQGLSVVRDAERAEPIEMLFGLWTPVGRRSKV